MKCAVLLILLFSLYRRLLGLTDNFYDEIKALPLGDGADERKSKAGFGSAGGLERKHKKRKVCLM